ncbi:MAG: hypothetical protein ACFB5Z_04995 [Elainellaceae cyanobacterium]
MSIFRQYVIPALILVVFLVAMVAVSARAFLPGDMAAPAPTETANSVSSAAIAPRTSAPAPQGLISQFFIGQFYVGQFYVQ